MKGRLPLFFILGILPLNLFAQAFAVAADKMNIAYVGIDNPLTIVSGNYDCRELSVTADQGEIITSDSCKYWFRANNKGIAIISVFRKTSSGKRLIGTEKLRVKLIPAPNAVVGGKSSGPYPLQQFKVQKGITAFRENCEMELQAVVQKFIFKIMRNGTLMSSVAAKGPLFGSGINNAMELLKPGDVVLIENIIIVGPDICPYHVPDLTYTMK